VNRPSPVSLSAGVLFVTLFTFAAPLWALDPPVYESSFGQSGNGNGQFTIPFAISVAPNGDVYVADLGNDRIQVFDANGVFKLKFGTSGAGDGQMSTPNGVAVDLSGNVYVADTGNNRIQKFDKDGNFLAKIGTKGNGIGQFSNLHGLAFDNDAGLLYVADTGNHRVQVFRLARVPGQ